MFATAIILALLVGGFIGCNTTVLVAIQMDKREEQKKAARAIHPSVRPIRPDYYVTDQQN